MNDATGSTPMHPDQHVPPTAPADELAATAVEILAEWNAEGLRPAERRAVNAIRVRVVSATVVEASGEDDFWPSELLTTAAEQHDLPGAPWRVSKTPTVYRFDAWPVAL
ncbi:hypothetical protein DFJ67_3845 [Asanoa ferruginea]|uniref:Uncharacterized protein n=1 Tax=Asanoa ferruginea TaxID=53367 RepID=A0A3D9ZKC8_9ACTN|nr:hypothetical protein [Asanoa ferruginea]REF97838.1 hypothetical protein DFJ67_3845 [Asanoa ferruginea]GIF52980.1 hypothetical protein Afe04nite_75190 [Asanoa ferruginea]